MKRVLVDVKSIQRDADGKDETYEFFSNGQYYEKNNAKYIMYDESATTGLDGVKTTIKITAEAVTLIRTGAVKMRHKYILGKTSESILETVAGKLPMKVKTHEYSCAIQDGQGALHLGYDISIAGEWQFYNQINIRLREDK